MQPQNPPYGQPAISADQMAPQNPPYGQPVTSAGQMGPQNQAYGQPGLPIVINQQSPVAMANPLMFKTTPIALTCIFCNKPCTTVVQKKCNVCACLLCWCTGLLCYVCIQCCRQKDICFCDATHTCPNCGQVVGTYTAC